MRSRIQYQAGFLIPLALFILVVMGGTSIAITRMGLVNRIGPMQEHLSMQAYYAARTGAEYTLHNIYFLPPQNDPDSVDVIDYTHVQAVCDPSDTDDEPIDKIEMPASKCSATISCQWRCVTANANSNLQILELTIISQGICGSEGELWADRTIEVGSVFDDGSSVSPPSC